MPGPSSATPGRSLESWVSDALGHPHLIVMGRVTYQALAEISWSATDEVSTRMNDIPKAVVSNTLAEPLAWANTRLIRGDLGEQIGTLKRQSPLPLRSIGSITLVGGMMRLGLVDRLRVAVFPLILGDAGREPPSPVTGGQAWSWSAPGSWTPGSSCSNTGRPDGPGPA